MCGLYGYITTKPDQTNNYALRILALANQERGIDSTGIATYKNGRSRIYRDTDKAKLFFADRNLTPYSMALGHNRLAVIGAINKENSQPFRVGKVIGTHNGIVSNYDDIGKFDVDSTAIFYLLDKHKNDFVTTLSKLCGSMALAWEYDQNLYLLRHQNPLHMLLTADTIFYSSLQAPLSVINMAFNLNGHLVIPDYDVVYEITPKLKINKTKISTKPYYYAKPSKQSTYPYSYDNYNYPREYDGFATYPAKRSTTIKKGNEIIKLSDLDADLDNDRPLDQFSQLDLEQAEKELINAELDLIEQAEDTRMENGCHNCQKYIKDTDTKYWYDYKLDRVYHNNCLNQYAKQQSKYILIDPKFFTTATADDYYKDTL